MLLLKKEIKKGERDTDFKSAFEQRQEERGRAKKEGEKRKE